MLSRARTRLRVPGWVASVALVIALQAGACSRRSGSGDGNGAPPLEVRVTLGGIGDTPGRFVYPRAIQSDPFSKNVWVIDRSGRVQEINPRTNRCVTLFKMPVIDRGFPVGLTIGPGVGAGGKWTERLLYIADTHNSQVMIVEPPPVRDERTIKPDDPPLTVEPTIVRTFGHYGTGPGEFIYPTDVAVLTNADGSAIERIYVSEYGGHDRVSVFDAQFNFVSTFGAIGSSDGGPDKSIVEFNRPQEMHFLHAGAPVEWEGSTSAGKAAPGLARPDELLIVDARNHRLGLFDLDGRLRKWIGSPDKPGNAPGSFLFPWSACPLGDKTVLVAEFQGCRLQRVSLETGESLGCYGHAGLGPGELNNPWCLTALGEMLYVVDARNNRVLGADRRVFR